MTDQNPLVSIIVITYNSAKFVLETLESAKAQTYHNIELIVSDDCSTDDTVEICRKWIEENKERFVRTELITSDKNTGIPANCNRGVKAAKGEWVKLIAGDDILLKDCILNNLIFSTGNNLITVIFSQMNMYLNNFEAENYFKTVPEEYPEFFFGKQISAKEQLNLMLESDRIGFTATCFIKNDVIKKVNGYDEKLKLVEDYPFWIKLLMAGERFYFMPKITINYRIHNSNTFFTNNKYLVHPSFPERESFRKDYIYPNVKWLYKMSFKHKYLVSLFLIKILKNKYSKINHFIAETLMIRLNFFYRIIQIFNIKIR